VIFEQGRDVTCSRFSHYSTTGSAASDGFQLEIGHSLVVKQGIGLEAAGGRFGVLFFPSATRTSVCAGMRSGTERVEPGGTKYVCRTPAVE
jgi:hypothetical protein